MAKRKIINDPIYGFITIDDELIHQVINHHYFQRLRRIQQMAMANVVYPGAVHSRLHHAFGAYHLACCALSELKNKQIDISPEEETAVKIAVLLHDVGHGPFSHALEKILLPNTSHETMSELIMQAMNKELNQQLNLAIDIFKGNYHKPFLHQLISGQLDVDRMDYLTRDSFFTGVSEGVIGYDRIIKMLAVHNNQLVVEEKGIYSIEKFLIARRQMYWQVYLHKTVLAIEKMLIKVIERVRFLILHGNTNLLVNEYLDYFIVNENTELNHETIFCFTQLDDVDVLYALKKWQKSDDVVLSYLCSSILNRKLLKVKLQASTFDEIEIEERKKEAKNKLHINSDEVEYVVFTGETANTLYKTENEHIQILFKNGSIKTITDIADPLIHKTISSPIKKYYLCSLT